MDLALTPSRIPAGHPSAARRCSRRGRLQLPRALAWGLAALLALLAGGVQAQTAAARAAPEPALLQKITGDYASRGSGGLTMRVLVLDDSDGLTVVRLLTASGPCTGDFAGSGLLQGRQLNLQPVRKQTPEDRCAMAVSFDAAGQRASIQPNDACRDYSGSACGFGGDVFKRRN